MTSDEKSNSEYDQPASRYSRQIRFPHLGRSGQEKLAQSTALVVGCGALGSVIANTLARAGVGCLKIVDRDFLEKSNLQRQVLFDESDVENGLPKAIAAAEKLRKINSEIKIEPIVADVDASNIESLCENVDVILDGSDNFEIRFLINDVAVKHSIPWVYGGCLGADGQTMTILPGGNGLLELLDAGWSAAAGDDADLRFVWDSRSGHQCDRFLGSKRSDQDSFGKSRVGQSQVNCGRNVGQFCQPNGSVESSRAGRLSNLQTAAVCVAQWRTRFTLGYIVRPQRGAVELSKARDNCAQGFG